MPLYLNTQDRKSRPSRKAQSALPYRNDLGGIPGYTGFIPASNCIEVCLKTAINQRGAPAPE